MGADRPDYRKYIAYDPSYFFDWYLRTELNTRNHVLMYKHIENQPRPLRIGCKKEVVTVAEQASYVVL